MNYEKTIRAGEGTLVREQEYDYHWCYERGIITKAWLDVYEKTGDKRFYDAAKQNVDRYVTADGEILTYEPEKYNLDMICMGRSALRLYKATGDERYEKACRRLTEQLRHQPTTPEGGFWHRSSIRSRCGWTASIWHAVHGRVCGGVRRSGMGGYGCEADDAYL